jgi:flagellar biosynthetic protein FliR
MLNPFEPGPAAAIALFATRLGGFLLIAPVYSARTIPAAVRVAFLIALTAMMAPIVTAGGAAPVVTPATLLTETLIGFALGFGAAVFVGAAEVAGDVLSLQTGFSGASTLDPMTMVQSPLLADFLKRVVITLMLALGGHLLMLDALAESVSIVPLGSSINGADGLMALALLCSRLFTLGLQIAAPVMAAVFVGNLAMGILARTAPQLQIFMLAYPLQIVIGTSALALAMPLLGVTFAGWNDQYRDVATGLLETLGGR